MSRETALPRVTGKEVIKWLRQNGKVEGPMSAETANQYATCVRQVLAAQPNGLDTPLAELDLEAAAEAFRRTNGKPSGQSRRRPQTVDTYIASFKAAVRGFLRQVTGEERQRVTQRRWSFPLRTDFVARLTLPVDLRPDEAERLGQFLQSLAIVREVEYVSYPPGEDAEIEDPRP
jgi:hypothetical protein